MSDGPAVSVTFDDCYEHTVENVLPLLDEFGVTATFYVVPNLVGREFEGVQLADWDLLGEVVERGHEIGSHTMNHRRVPTSLLEDLRRAPRSVRDLGLDAGLLGRAARRAVEFARSAAGGDGGPEFDPTVELAHSKRVLEEKLGVEVRSFAYPWGVHSAGTADRLESLEYTSARTTVPGRNTGGTDPYALRSYVWDGSTDPVAMNSLVEDADRGWVVHTLHSVELDGDGSGRATTVPELAAHLRYVVRSTEAVVRPVSAGVERWVRGSAGRSPATPRRGETDAVVGSSSSASGERGRSSR